MPRRDNSSPTPYANSAKAGEFPLVDPVNTAIRRTIYFPSNWWSHADFMLV